MVVNLFAVRATDPKDMKAANDPVGPDNMGHIKDAIQYVNSSVHLSEHGSESVICAWGAHGSYMDQDETVLGWIESEGGIPFCLGETKAGFPKHPLYLPSDAMCIRYTGRQK